MEAICQFCGIRNDIPYILVGAAVICQACGECNVLRTLFETRPPDTGYRITFSDFHQLLAYPEYRPSIAPLLRGWYGYELEQVGESVRIRAQDGEEVDELTLHKRIQGEAAKQAALYRAAMTVWR